MANQLEDKEDGFYADAKKYWEKVSPTVDGMLGGYSHISSTDIGGSARFLKHFLVSGRGNTPTTRALDCGAGIGRTTRRLLLPIFQTVDMVEVNQSFLDEAKQSFLGEEASRVENYFCCGLQNFTPEPGRYDLIWSQWVLGHLYDDDLVAFFQRCKKGLSPNGIMVVKENMNSEDSVNFDDNDSSMTRPKDDFVHLILKSGFKILREEKQKHFPKEIFGVWMFALQ